jgi:hypothetical protein
MLIGNLHIPNDANSPITHSMAQKVGGSGLSYTDLSTLYQKYGETAVVAVLSMEPTTKSWLAIPKWQKHKNTRKLQFYSKSIL